MRRIEILHELPNGRIVGRADYQPKLKSTVFADRYRRRVLGRVYEVFGPVKKPYISIIPTDKTAKRMALRRGEAFISDEKRGRYSKRRNPRK
ncbi:MAG TPA: H/ACA RNA-protein complex protein Gar1 [Methanothermococcus okinawensis]|uniref:H/ACA RNA-protein complex protein Gar1 n=1 Tax=Methanothermococcus okinawensis TaxID=155863 RepID=A0A833E508_9EURY|nr:H/ACA RNA-protein complex protein Gar1 [Methanococcaceae archaeon]HIP84897.1 H/ACA RNA-protein complex protein Gar1 [Methanothermococcus okinawensis]HIP91144.1 H/ACA RNA-protein complex protein Gar1 [Methanothermococcus okinawensis]